MPPAPGLAFFTIRKVALAAAVPRHPSWKGWIRASAKASSSSLGRVARRLLILLFYAYADSLQNRMEKAYIRFCRQNYSLCYNTLHVSAAKRQRIQSLGNCTQCRCTSTSSYM